MLSDGLLKIEVAVCTHDDTDYTFNEAIRVSYRFVSEKKYVETPRGSIAIIYGDSGNVEQLLVHLCQVVVDYLLVLIAAALTSNICECPTPPVPLIQVHLLCPRQPPMLSDLESDHGFAPRCGDDGDDGDEDAIPANCADGESHYDFDVWHDAWSVGVLPFACIGEVIQCVA